MSAITVERSVGEDKVVLDFYNEREHAGRMISLSHDEYDSLKRGFDARQDLRELELFDQDDAHNFIAWDDATPEQRLVHRLRDVCDALGDLVARL